MPTTMVQRQETHERANLCLPAAFFLIIIFFFPRWGDVMLYHITVFALLAFDFCVIQHSQIKVAQNSFQHFPRRRF